MLVFLFVISPASHITAQNPERPAKLAEVRSTASRQAPSSLTLAYLEQTALQSNPTLVQAAAKLEAARGRTTQAGLYPNPTIGYTGEEIGAAGTAGQQGIFIDQVIVTAGKLRLNRAKFAQEITQSEWQATAQQYRVLNGVRMRFYKVLALERLIEVQTGLVQVADDAVR